MNHHSADKGHSVISPSQTLLLILVPMVVTVVGLRLKLHFIGIRHLYVFGYIVRHLFSGALVVILAAFVLAFRPSRPWAARVATVALGVGSALVLDEVVFLIATNASKEEYVSPLSLAGSGVFICLAVILLLVLYWLKRDRLS